MKNRLLILLSAVGISLLVSSCFTSTSPTSPSGRSEAIQQASTAPSANANAPSVIASTGIRQDQQPTLTTKPVVSNPFPTPSANVNIPRVIDPTGIRNDPRHNIKGPIMRKKLLNFAPSKQEKDDWCSIASVQMILRSQGKEVTQKELAQEIPVYPGFGVHNADSIRVLNQRLFGYPVPGEGMAGYRLYTIPDDSGVESTRLARRLRANIADGYPIFLTVRTDILYDRPHGYEHNVVAVGYTSDEAIGGVETILFYDPWGPFWTGPNQALKEKRLEKILEAMLPCEEPQYAW